LPTERTAKQLFYGVILSGASFAESKDLAVAIALILVLRVRFFGCPSVVHSRLICRSRFCEGWDFFAFAFASRELITGQ
jgi:hypothetical protein